jgi:uncharacterized membrane protein
MLIIFTLMLPVLLAMLALTFDLGFGLVERRSVQNFADATAMAGANTLGSNTPPTVQVHDSDVYNTLYDVLNNSTLPPEGSSFAITTPTGVGTTIGQVYIVAEYTDGSSPPVGQGVYVTSGNTSLPTSYMGVKSAATYVSGTFFASLIGFPTITVSATATAVAKYVQPAGVLGFNVYAARWEGPSLGPQPACRRHEWALLRRTGF